MACTAVDVLQDDVLLARAKAIIRRACDARPMSARCRTNWIRPSRCPRRSSRLAGTRLAGDQNRRVTVGEEPDGLLHLTHPEAVTDQFVFYGRH
jgi:hypothetical protein